MADPKLSIITAFLGQTKDRFHTYNKPLTVEEKFQLMNEIPGMSGVEIIYPYEVSDAVEIKGLLDKYNLGVAAINVNVKAEPEFVSGGLTSDDPAVRAKAVQFIKDAKDFAKAVGADKVQCCPLGDGYEFQFQYDYMKTWKYLVDTFGEAGEYLPEIPLFIEFKPSETRGACFLENAAKTLCLLNDIDNTAIGTTLDFGHSIYGGNNPAEELCLLEGSKFPYYIHINDNNGRWDWDYFCGSKNFLDYVEFIYYLKRFGYNDYLTSDTSPTRWDIKGTFEANTRVTVGIWRMLDEIGMDEFTKRLSPKDYLETWKFIEQNVFKIKY
ncbi:sugar phosphate isomerase/epimerase [Pseudodesulfovibrio sp.]|nr:sugar phosphate isomerase/epimerase [Pseudodesulfovibrio sp.]